MKNAELAIILSGADTLIIGKKVLWDFKVITRDNEIRINGIGFDENSIDEILDDYVIDTDKVNDYKLVNSFLRESEMTLYYDNGDTIEIEILWKDIEVIA